MEHRSSKQVCFRGFTIIILLTVVTTVSASNSSPCISETIDTTCTCLSPPPRPPSPCYKVPNLVESGATHDSVSASWSAPCGVYGYRVTCSNGSNVGPQNISADETMFTCTNLPTPGAIYTITITTLCRNSESKPCQIPITSLYNITPPVTPERQTSDKFPLMFVSLPCSLVLSLIAVALINNYKKPTYQVKTNISTCTKDNAGVFPVANCRLPFRGGQNESTEEGFNVTKDTAKLSVGDDQPGTRTSCMSYDNASYAHLRATVPTGDQQDFDTVMSYNGLNIELTMPC
ncbi:uncharacterized protein LOC100889167 isoform X2 [Strongylocentrotus purpuratus]|uniref:Fibronectin type-III domain-containing protein n=1 Tax=Strongylocentrotus purpuratus TaxID=7668 RepID=A0A7M7T017_STRPU|nr:uncharacterized protein LOC100889167 isoform X2 [Strongylocentrotus purpuratus]